jgi:hypothetical protein
MLSRSTSRCVLGDSDGHLLLLFKKEELEAIDGSVAVFREQMDAKLK